MASILSLIVHWAIVPWNLLPSTSGIEVKDIEGELAIPIDLLGEEPPPPPPPPPPLPEEPPAPVASDPAAPGRPDAGPRRLDAGSDASLDASLLPEGGLDAGKLRDASRDDAPLPSLDASSPEAGLLSDAGEPLASLGDGGALSGPGPRDPESMFGLTKVVNAGVQNVVLGMNVAVIRKHPLAASLGLILRAVPQWRDFMRGAPSTLDPIRDTDWILIYGPSLIHTDRDAVLVRYNIPDALVDTTISAIAKTYDKGGAFDAGVRGVTASLGFADNGQRVFLRPQPRLLVIVPPSHAHEAAVTFRKQSPRGPSDKEAMRLIVREPSRQVAIPGLKFSQAIREIRLWIVTGDESAVEIFAEGDCADEASATEAAARLTEVLRRQNVLMVQIATRGLLNGAAVVADGEHIRLHIKANSEQVESVMQLVGGLVGADLPPPRTMPSVSP